MPARQAAGVLASNHSQNMRQPPSGRREKSMKKSSIGVIAAAIAIVGATVWYLQGASSNPAGANSAGGKGAAQPPTVVSVVKPLRQDVPVALQSNGTVTPLSTVDLHPQTTSTIRTVHIKEGQFVKKGELMFSLDDRSDAANVDKAHAQIARDQAALADVERQYKRSQDLVAQKFLAQSAVDTLKSQVDAAAALLKADQAALRSSGVSASYNTIRAPITVSFTLPETALGDLLAAQERGKVAVQASATSNTAASGEARPVTGAISFIDNTVDPQSGTIRVKALFDNPDSSLWPGQYVNTRVTVQTLPGAIVIPQTAIITNTRGTFVYVVDADQSARQVPVSRLHAWGLNAAVSGLSGDEKVITDGKQNLRPGGKVKLADSNDKKGANAGAPAAAAGAA